jgi:hypothetical protein
VQRRANIAQSLEAFLLMEAGVSFNKQSLTRPAIRELLATDTDTDGDPESTVLKKLNAALNELNAALDASKKNTCTFS